MVKAEQLITDKLDVWTSAVKAKSSAGRGSNKRLELYGVSKLRGLILDLAARGLLVAQDPEDESVDALLDKIAESKNKLTKDKRMRKKQPSEEINPSEAPFTIPTTWAWRHFQSIADIASNLVKPDDFPEYLHLAPDNIEKENGRLLKCRTVKEDKVRSPNHRFYPGQLIYSKIRPNLSKVVVVDFDGLCSADMYPVDSFLDTRFLQKYMLSKAFLRQAVKSDTRVAMPKINQSELNKVVVPIPPLAEQHRIVAKVDELMALCDQLEQEQESNIEAHETLVSTLLNALTSASADASQFSEAWQRIQSNFDILFTTESSVNQLKQTILQLAVMGKLVQQDSELDTSIIEHSEEISVEEIPYAKPPGWKWKRISDHVNIRGGSQPSKNTFANEPKDGYTRLIQIRDFKSDNFKTYIPIELANRPFTKEDIMIGRYGPPVFQILRGLEGSYNVALMKADPDLKYITRDYLFYLLQEPRIQKIIIDESERTAGQSGIRLPLLNSIFYGLPPISEQHCIVARIEALMALCDHLKTSLASAQATQLNLADSLVGQAIK